MEWPSDEKTLINIRCPRRGLGPGSKGEPVIFWEVRLAPRQRRQHNTP